MPTDSAATQSERPRLLLIDLWGIGDLALATGFLRRAIARYQVSVLAKPHAQEFLQPSFPEIQFIPFTAPWTAFRGKYHFWRWPWITLILIWRRLFFTHFQVAVSVRNDPRDHALMWLIGARHRYGFPTHGSGMFLNHSVQRSTGLQHKVADWNDLANAAALDGPPSPWLNSDAYSCANVAALINNTKRPIFAIHAGASALVRRWPEPNFVELIKRLRQTFSFTLLVIPDPDGYGAGLKEHCDIFVPSMALSALVDLIGHVDLLFCNDSGPGHIAACCGTPTITFFGPAEPVQFRPWGDMNLVVERNVCQYRPCRDYCKFAEPICMTALNVELVWPEIEQHIQQLIAAGKIPS